MFLEAKAPINIALVKYWGKIDEEFIIPANSSLSITINSDDLCTTTKVTLLDHEAAETMDVKDECVLVLNGKREKISERVQRIIETVKSRSQKVITAKDISD